nr:carboxypeptidase-like regulatory domain-containing protein [uncultured Porphyromonas sp.]
MRHIPLCRWLHFLAFVLLTILPLGAQSYRGRVLEAHTQLPVVGAKVLLFARDTTFLSGTTTDSLGYFGLDYQQGTQPAYLLSVRAVGYEPLWSDLHAPHEYSLYLTPSLGN